MLFLQVLYPSLLAFLRMILSIGVLMLLFNMRPHIFTHTFWVDVACYSCLVAQFGLQAVFAQTEYLGISLTEDQKRFLKAMNYLSLTFRFVF